MRTIAAASIAAIAALAAWLFFAAPGLADDGSQIVQEFCRPDGLRLWYHALYFPAAEALASLGVRPDRALWLLSALAGGVLVGCAYASAWVVTGHRRAAATTALTVALTPAVGFHATYVEVHALHAAVVAAAVLTLLLLSRWPRRVLQAAVVGAALAVLTHRSAALLVPALAAVAAAALQQSGAPRAGWRAALATAAGASVGYGADELLHRWLGGPGLFDSVQQVRDAQSGAGSAMLFDEFLLPLCLLWFAGAVAFSARARRSGALRWAPLLALAAYGLPIAVAGIATHGGYWLGAVPVLALGVAMQLPAVLGRGWFGRLAIVAALALSAWLAVRTTVTDPSRHAQGELRSRRIAAATVWLPEGGTLLSTCLGMQYVDGAVADVQEIDVANYIGYSLISGSSIEAVVAGVIRLVAASVDGRRHVVWSSEWRDLHELPREFHAVMAGIEARVVAEFRSTPIASGFGQAWRLQPHDGPR